MHYSLYRIMLSYSPAPDVSGSAPDVFETYAFNRCTLVLQHFAHSKKSKMFQKRAAQVKK